MLYLKNNYKTLKHIIIIPIVSSLIFPLIIIDILTEFYHRTCFPLCNIPYVKRKKYIKLDRHKLGYLTFWQKAYCIYCGYWNGLVNYLTKIASETEKYWCGIKHEEDKTFIAPRHHKEFAEYNDKLDFKQKYKG